MRGNAQPFQPQESTASARSRLAMLLAGATDSQLASFTSDSLAATHRVKFPEVVEMLAEARRKRGLA